LTAVLAAPAGPAPARAKAGKAKVRRKEANPQKFPKLWAFSYLGDAPCRFIK
jgi:hypothetical protein